MEWGTKGQGRAQPEHLWLPLEENPLSEMSTAGPGSLNKMLMVMHGRLCINSAAHGNR